MKTRSAFAPGHISGFFQPVTESKNSNQIGSRGAGVCISDGATARVTITSSQKQKIHLDVNGKNGSFPVTSNAIKRVLGQESVQVKANITLDLPVGQGFGMSAASSLSSALAVADLIGKSRFEAIQAAHHAEVRYQTGLGDVCSAAVGGFEIRKKPGILPYGDIQKIEEKEDITLGIFPGSISTRKILTNQKKVDRISSIGSYCTDQVIKNPTVQSIMKYSYYFTKQTGLAPSTILSVLEYINYQTFASMCMLGHSIFMLRSSSEIEKYLSKQGIVLHTTVDVEGARLLNSSKK